MVEKKLFNGNNTEGKLKFLLEVLKSTAAYAMA